MILDSLERLGLYSTLYPKIKKVVQFLESNKSELLPLGRIEIDGNDIFVSVSDSDLKPEDEGVLEIHRRYIDIQIPLSKGVAEGFGWSPKEILSTPRCEFDTEKDIQFFDDIPQTIYTMHCGQFSIFTPDDAHAPLLGNGHLRKLIFKIAI